MSLLNLKTNLKSLKYGGDRPGGGSSGQPYIQTDIDKTPNQLPIASTDFLLRGGIKAPLNAATDVVRMTRLFTDLKSPKGLLFAAKQNLLSRTSVATEASIGISYGNNPSKDLAWTKAAVNQGIYNPLSTIAQSGVGFSGTHLNLLGIDPTNPITGQVSNGLFGNLGLIRYEDVIRGETNLTKKIKVNEVVKTTEEYEIRGRYDKEVFKGTRDVTKIVEKDKIVPLGANENRLIYLYSNNTIVPSESTNLLEYNGGPGSILGIGKTRIKFADQRTGINNPLYTTNRGYFILGGLANSPTVREDKPIRDRLLGLSLNDYNGIVLNTDELTGFNPEGDKLRSEDPTTFTTDHIAVTSSDFRKTFSPKGYSLSLDYKDPNNRIEGGNGSRIHYTSPGQKGDRSNYVKGKGIGPVDKINALPIYKSSKTDVKSKEGNDLVKFRMEIINPESPEGLREYIHFRAYIDDFSDSYGSKWDSIDYMGRGESFYKYGGGFERKIDLSFTVAAQSKEELMVQYQKLNFLASTSAPTYSKNGYMMGNLMTLTFGGWVYELPGFISGLNIAVPEESPWEIGIGNEEDDFSKGEYKNTVKEMPHIVKVTGFSFTPIHTFRPEKMKIKSIDGSGFVNEWGAQRYIALQGGSGDSYNKIPKPPKFP